MMILGIDVSKDKVDVALFDSKQCITSGEFTNTAVGFKKLSKWLKHKAVEQVWACMESTGRYGDALATYLYQQEHQVSVVNPARIRKYADSQLKRNKTDKLDAKLIADFCRTQEPALWSPPPPPPSPPGRPGGSGRAGDRVRGEGRTRRNLRCGPRGRR